MHTFLPMLDDRRAFDHRLPVIEEQREQSERRMPPQDLSVLRKVAFEDAIFEGRVVRPKRDQDFLSVAAEWVTEEL